MTSHVLIQALGSGNAPVKPRVCTKGSFLPAPARQFPEQNCKGKRIYETTAISQSKRKKIETALKRKKVGRRETQDFSKTKLIHVMIYHSLFRLY